MTNESIMTPYFAPCIQAVWPVPTNNAVTPVLINPCTMRQAVVRLPTAESVPNTAIFKDFTVSVFPFKK